MDFMSKHATFVIASYVISFGVLGALVGYILRRDRALAEKLKEPK